MAHIRRKKLIAKLISYSKPSEFTTYEKDMPKNCQDLIAFCARVSNPSNQNNTKTSEKLLNYLSSKHIDRYRDIIAKLNIRK